MRHCWIVLLVLFVGPVVRVEAHPPTGIIVDSQGRVFWSDLERVWMKVGDADPVVAVDDTHTHELHLDAADGVWGEDVRNVGDRYWHRIWVRRADGGVEHIRPLTEGHPGDRNDFGLQRLEDGTAVLAIRGDDPQVRFIHPDRTFTDVRFEEGSGYVGQTGAADGEAYVSRGSVLFRVTEEGMEAMSGPLLVRTQAMDYVHDRHAMLGIFEGPERAVCVAAFAGQSIECIDRSGTAFRLLESEGDWAPTGGAMAPDGALWVLEFNGRNESRVRRIDPEG